MEYTNVNGEKIIVPGSREVTIEGTVGQVRTIDFENGIALRDFSLAEHISPIEIKWHSVKAWSPRIDISIIEKGANVRVNGNESTVEYASNDGRAIGVPVITAASVKLLNHTL